MSRRTPPSDPVTRIALDDQGRHIVYVERPMWRSVMFWVGLLIVSVTVALASLGFAKAERASSAAKRLAVQESAEARARVSQLQDAFCGVPHIPGLLPTILSAKLPPNVSTFGRHIRLGAQHAAVILRCPGVKP